MRKLSAQTDNYLLGFRERIEKEGNTTESEWQKTVKKINYILSCREGGKLPLLCQGVCWGECGKACINNK